MSAAPIFRPAVRAAVWIVAGLSVIGTTVAILYGERLAPPAGGTRDSYAEAPLGSRALLETLEALGMHVHRERRGEHAGVGAPLVFVAPEQIEAIVDGSRRTLDEALRERAEAGLPTIVILPKWRWEGGEASPDPSADEVLAVVLPGATKAHASELSDAMMSSAASGVLGAYGVSLPYLQYVHGGGAEVLLATDAGHALVLRRADGVVVVTDPDLVANWNIHRADHAQVIVDLLAWLAPRADTIAIDEVFHGHGERRSLATALGEFPAVLLTGHALFVLLLVVWIGSRRFGRPRDLDPPVHGPAESIAVSAFVLAEGRSLATLANDYAGALVAEQAARLGAAPSASLTEQAAYVDRVAVRRGEEVRASLLLARAAEIARGSAPKADALALAQEAHRMRERLR